MQTQTDTRFYDIYFKCSVHTILRSVTVNLHPIRLQNVKVNESETFFVQFRIFASSLFYLIAYTLYSFLFSLLSTIVSTKSSQAYAFIVQVLEMTSFNFSRSIWFFQTMLDNCIFLILSLCNWLTRSVYLFYCKHSWLAVSTHLGCICTRICRTPLTLTICAIIFPKASSFALVRCFVIFRHFLCVLMLICWR